jgi:hypothetical protein
VVRRLAEDAGRELPAVGAEIAGVMEASILLENGETTDAADPGDEVAGGVLEGPVGHGEVRDQDGSAGSLLHSRKAIENSGSSIKGVVG